MATAGIILDTQKTAKNDFYPLKIRITHRNKNAQIQRYDNFSVLKHWYSDSYRYIFNSRLSKTNTDNQIITKTTPNFTPKGLKLGVTIYSPYPLAGKENTTSFRKNRCFIYIVGVRNFFCG